MNCVLKRLSQTATGAVSLAGSSSNIDGVVSASQSLTNSLMVEVGYSGVDALSGSYTMSLPVAAPKSAAFVSASVPLVFTANTAGRSRPVHLDCHPGERSAPVESG